MRKITYYSSCAKCEQNFVDITLQIHMVHLREFFKSSILIVFAKAMCVHGRSEEYSEV